MSKIFTAYDARRQKWHMDAVLEARIRRKELRAKIRKWERKVALEGGEVQIATLARFKAELEVWR